MDCEAHAFEFPARDILSGVPRARPAAMPVQEIRAVTPGCLLARSGMMLSGGLRVLLAAAAVKRPRRA
ncbi:MAG TPA: hypothetical protein VHV26_04345 [Rhizomicrobium sp.]|nr:hypothetical protein [Rhizomicrobium sp.]